MSGYVGSNCTLARSLNMKSDLKKLKSVVYLCDSAYL